MKRLVLSLGVAVLFVFSAGAQATSTSNRADDARKEKERQAQIQKQAEVQEQNPNAPVIKFDKLVHDYGEVMQHGDGKCEFTFTNEGKEPLILSNVRSSCGCTVPEWPRQPILPGQSETIKVKYDTKRIGAINKSVHVYSNASPSPVTLRITGKVLVASSSQMPEKNMDKEAAPINK